MVIGRLIAYRLSLIPYRLSLNMKTRTDRQTDRSEKQIGPWPCKQWGSQIRLARELSRNVNIDIEVSQPNQGKDASKRIGLFVIRTEKESE